MESRGKERLLCRRSCPDQGIGDTRGRNNGRITASRPVVELSLSSPGMSRRLPQFSTRATTPASQSQRANCTASGTSSDQDQTLGPPQHQLPWRAHGRFNHRFPLCLIGVLGVPRVPMVYGFHWGSQLTYCQSRLSLASPPRGRLYWTDSVAPLPPVLPRRHGSLLVTTEPPSCCRRY